MKILVCMKMVAKSSYTDLLNSDDESGSRLSSGTADVNPADAYALESVLRLRDVGIQCEITVLTMGPDFAEQILRNAIAMGADTAIHITDKQFAGSDTIATAGIISKAIKRLPTQDLIVCGKKAIDSETGHIGPQIAALLDIPCVTDIIEFDGESFIRAQTDGIVSGKIVTPLLLTVINGTSMVRMPTIMGIRKSSKAEIIRMDSSVIEPVRSGTETIKIYEHSFCKRNGDYDNDADTAAKKVLGMI